MKQESNTMQTSAAYLAADSQTKEIVKAIPTTFASLPNYGGDELPVSMVVIQSYNVTRVEREKTKEFKQVFKPALGTDGKQKFEMKETGKDSDGNPVFTKVLQWEDEYSFKQITNVTGKQKLSTLSVIPLRYQSDKPELNHIVGCGFTELLKGIEDGRTIERQKFFKLEDGSEDSRIEKTVVKTAIRKGSILHVFVKFNGMVYSTTQVNGGAKGSDLLSNPHETFKNLFNQLKSATETGKKAVINERIATALGLIKKAS